MKKYIILLIIVFLIITAVLGVYILPMLQKGVTVFSENPNSEDYNNTNLWILTEKTVADGMNYQVDIVIEMLKSKYPNTEFNLDILPTTEPERTTYISQVRKQIENGQGPDLFLLPTNEVLALDEPEQYTYVQVDPFFQVLRWK